MSYLLSNPTSFFRVFAWYIHPAGSGFDPFATAFSRKSRTHLQELAEQGLAHLSESQARRQQRFSKLEERNITILLPLAKLQRPQETLVSSGDSVETEEEEKKGPELELVAQLWRERMAHDEVERFETTAAKKLRLLRSTKLYPYVVLRVRLPGGVYLQGRFNLEETLEVRDRDNLCSPRTTLPAMLTGELDTRIYVSLQVLNAQPICGSIGLLSLEDWPACT